MTEWDVRLLLAADLPLGAVLVAFFPAGDGAPSAFEATFLAAVMGFFLDALVRTVRAIRIGGEGTARRWRDGGCRRVSNDARSQIKVKGIIKTYVPYLCDISSPLTELSDFSLLPSFLDVTTRRHTE